MTSPFSVGWIFLIVMHSLGAAQLPNVDRQPNAGIFTACQDAPTEPQRETNPNERQRSAAATLEDAMAGLAQRRENGEALTPQFVELYLTTAERLAEAQLPLCVTDNERRATVKSLFTRVKWSLSLRREYPIIPVKPMPQLDQIDYHSISAKHWAAEVEKTCSSPSPHTQPVENPTPAELANAAKIAYESLQGRGDVSITTVDLLNRYSQRWADAEHEAATDRSARILAYENHLRRMKELAGLLDKKPNEINQVQTSLVHFYILEAQSLLAKEERPK